MKRVSYLPPVQEFLLSACLLVFSACLVSCGQRLVTPVQQARERVLKNDLAIMRQALDNYTLDKQKPPQSLQDLVDAGYIREVPVDPFTDRRDWVLMTDDVPLSTKSSVHGLVDVQSSSANRAANGTAVNTW